MSRLFLRPAHLFTAMAVLLALPMVPDWAWASLCGFGFGALVLLVALVGQGSEGWDG